MMRRPVKVRRGKQNTVFEGKGRDDAASKLLDSGVLEFFGRDKVAQVVKDSPKLHEPEKVES